MNPSSPSEIAAGGRGQWRGRMGFALAASGAALGVAMLRDLPGAALAHGGPFMTVYFLAVVVVGLPIVLAELAMGGVVIGLGFLVARSTATPASLSGVPGLAGTVDFGRVLESMTADWLLPLGALFTCLFLGWAVPSLEKEEEVRYGPISGFLYYVWDHLLLKFVCPIAIVLVFAQRLSWLDLLLDWLRSGQA